MSKKPTDLNSSKGSKFESSTPTMKKTLPPLSEPKYLSHKNSKGILVQITNKSNGSSPDMTKTKEKTGRSHFKKDHNPFFVTHEFFDVAHLNGSMNISKLDQISSDGNTT